MAAWPSIRWARVWARSPEVSRPAQSWAAWVRHTGRWTGGWGSPPTQTRSFADLAVTSAANLRVVFNALEPGGAANSINLNSLTLSVYNAAGTQTLFTANLDQPYSFANTFTGAGNSGFVFALTSIEASQLQSVFASSDRVGLSASASNATGGFETFFVANSPTVAAIPEPETYALMMAGLGVVGFMARRRKR